MTTELKTAAAAAKADQLAAMAAAKDAMSAYWAGSISASVGHHYARKAYSQTRAR
jgi:hypothetical protein